MKLFAPENCPSCGMKLVLSKTGVDLFCLNTENCPDQIVLRLSYFCSRKNANITGLSDKILKQLNQKLGVCDVPDLYNLPFHDIASWEGFGGKSASNLKVSLAKSKESFEGYKFLSSLGIDGIGPEVAKLILETLDLE